MCLITICFATTSVVAEQVEVTPPPTQVQASPQPPPPPPTPAEVSQKAANMMATRTQKTDEELAVHKRNVMLGVCVAFFVVGLTASKIYSGKKVHTTRQ